jgi:hypothetical protein
VSGNLVYAGGAFTAVAGKGRGFLAALDATTGAATDWNPRANNPVDALAVDGGTVYVGGNFTGIGGKEHSFFATLDVTTGTATEWEPQADGPVETLVIDESVVYAGGEFTGIGGQARGYFAAFRDTPPTVVTTPASNISATGATFNGVVNARGGAATITFQYTTVSGDYSQAVSVATTPGSVSGALDTPVTATVSGLIPATTYYYRLVATGAGGATTGAEQRFTTLAAPTATPDPTPPTIGTQPLDLSIVNGQSATLTVVAIGAPPLSYQWYQGVSGDTSAPLPGATAATFTTPPLNATTSYWVRVTNAGGATDSATATITVLPPQPVSDEMNVFLPVVVGR